MEMMKKIVVSIKMIVFFFFVSNFRPMFDFLFTVTLAKTLSDMKNQPIDTPLAPSYKSEGFVVFNEKGMVGKLCTENLNATLGKTEMDTVLQTAAASLCTLLSYT